MENVTVSDKGNVVVCGEELPYPYESIVGLSDKEYKNMRDRFRVGTHGWQLFQCLRDRKGKF